MMHLYSLDECIDLKAALLVSRKNCHFHQFQHLHVFPSFFADSVQLLKSTFHQKKMSEKSKNNVKTSKKNSKNTYRLSKRQHKSILSCLHHERCDKIYKMGIASDD